MPGLFENTNPDHLRKIFEATDIRRVPMTGIVSGYHTLPFTLVGPNDESDAADAPKNPGSLKLTGKISVSPKLVVSISPNDERFAEIFPESEPFMDRSLVGRMFSFSTAYRRNHRIRNENLSVEAYPDPSLDLLEKVMTEIQRGEIINMGVIWCPQPRFYPISLERFISAVVVRELG